MDYGHRLVTVGTMTHQGRAVVDFGARPFWVMQGKPKRYEMSLHRSANAGNNPPSHRARAQQGRGSGVVLDAWERALVGRGMAPATVAVYLQTARSLAGDHDVRTVTAGQLEDWLAGLHVSTRTRSAYVVRLRQLFKWLVREGYRPDDPCAVIAMPKSPALVPRPLPDRWFRQLWQVADARERAWVALGAFCGLRASEAALVRVEDFSDGWLRVTGKGARTRFVPVRAEVLAAIDAYGWPDAGRVFPGVSVKAPSVAVGKLLRQVGAPAMFTFHSLRHRFASSLYRSCGDLRVVQQLLGHSSLATTAIYLQVDDQHARASVLAMPGLVA